MKRDVQSSSPTAPREQSTPDAGSWKVQLKQDLRGLNYAEQVDRVQLKGDGDGKQASEAVARAGFGEGKMALPYRGEMESHFGADLGGISAHLAPEACDTLGAQAYAFQRSVAFESAAPSRATVAHELTHVLGGGEAEAQAAESTIGRGISQACGRYSPMGSGVVQRRATPGQEDKLRQGVADGMHLANTGGGMRYYKPGVDPEKWSGGRAPEQYWEKVGWYTFRLREGQSASEAMDALFAGPTILECLSTTKAILIRSILKTIGAQRFDRQFGESGGKNQQLTITATGRSELDPFLGGALIQPSEIKVGDWGYFHNHPRYLVKHPGGFWQGENAVYVGDGKWAGFGANNKTARQMVGALKDAYNRPRTSVDDRRIEQTIADVSRNLTDQGYGDDTLKKVKKTYDDYYADFPETVTAADIPGIDEGNAIKKEVAKQIDELNLREKQTLALIDEWAAKHGGDAQAARRQVVQEHVVERNKLQTSLSRADANKGKRWVTRLDADRVAGLGQ